MVSGAKGCRDDGDPAGGDIQPWGMFCMFTVKWGACEQPVLRKASEPSSAVGREPPSGDGSADRHQEPGWAEAEALVAFP